MIFIPCLHKLDSRNQTKTPTLGAQGWASHQNLSFIQVFIHR